MRYHVIACDYDGTLAHDGIVPPKVVAALENIITTGRKLILVSGRRLEDLKRVFPEINLFERVVAENGAVVYNPKTHDTKVIAEAYSNKLVEALQKRKVSPIEVGHSIVATCEPYEVDIIDAIQELGLESHVIFNKGAIMVLPSGTNKESGLRAALIEMGYSLHNAVAVGDAENDHALLGSTECSFAVANCVPAIREKADYVTKKDHGEGVIELFDMLLKDDLSSLENKLVRHDILLGDANEKKLYFSPYGNTMLVCGASGSGKSLTSRGIIERLAAANYQYCLIDPEGDYEAMEGATVLGSPQSVPSVEEVIHNLRIPNNTVVNLLGLSVDERPKYFAKLFPHLQELKTLTGRPHWLIIDEAHYLIPASWEESIQLTKEMLAETLFITVHPSHLAKPVLAASKVIITVGENPKKHFADICKVLDIKAPDLQSDITDKEITPNYVWFRNSKKPAQAFVVAPPEQQHHRHIRKYAEGDLGDKSFYFTGADQRLNLKAQNLYIFNQIAEGVDDDTWQYHLKRHEYSKWFKTCIKDDDLAFVAESIENSYATDPLSSRAQIKAAIEERYTPPV